MALNLSSKWNLYSLCPKTANPAVEGLRLAGLNFSYIIVSMSLFFLFTYSLPSLLVKLGVKYAYLYGILMLLALFVVLFAGVFYFYLWGWFTNRFFQRIEHQPKPKRKFFLLGVLGATPNFALWLGFPYWVQFLPGAESDACGGILFFAFAYLIFMITALAMPFFGWLHLINYEAKKLR